MKIIRLIFISTTILLLSCSNEDEWKYCIDYCYREFDKCTKKCSMLHDSNSGLYENCAGGCEDDGKECRINCGI